LSVGRTSCFFVPLIAAAFAACGGASGTDFDNEPSGSAGESNGGTSGSAQGGSGGASGSSSGSGGTQGGQGGTEALGGSSTGGSASGGDSGTGTGGSSTGGSSTGGSSTGGSPTGGSPTGGSGGAGSGGTGPGGIGGRGGGGGKSGAGGRGGDCTAIVTSAQAALVAAQACIPTSMTPKCTGSVQDLCGCTVPVNDPNSDATKSYLAQREAAIACGVPCLAIVCREPTTATCGFAGATTNIVVAPSHCTYSPR
jgi:hypothetical protein